MDEPLYLLQSVASSAEAIARKFEQPFYTAPEFWAIAAALLLGAFGPAVGGAIAEAFKRRFHKSRLIPVEIITTNQENAPENEPVRLLDVIRLAITNAGKYSARGVQAYIHQMEDNGEVRPNFIPMPLTWTHGDVMSERVSVRDIHPNQTVHLDLMQNISDHEYVTNRVHLAVPTAQDVESLSKLARGKSRLLIRLYQESGDLIEIPLNVSWDGRRTPEVSQD